MRLVRGVMIALATTYVAITVVVAAIYFLVL